MVYFDIDLGHSANDYEDDYIVWPFWNSSGSRQRDECFYKKETWVIALSNN